MLTLGVLFAILATISAVEKRESLCYGNLGCFQTTASFKVLPQNPNSVRTKFQLYTRQNKGSPSDIQANAPHATWGTAVSASHFVHSKATKFIIHGFLDNGHRSWVLKTKDALLSQGDYNIFVVNWEHGATLPYEQATANVFLVAEETAQFVKYLHSNSHVNYNNIHCIGHSLGAQACGNFGGKVRGLGRITGLDPAQPYFDQFDHSRYLDASDANFVDIIHSDGADFSGIRGYGWIKALGHVDFYPNGGIDQPGCADNPVGNALNNLLHGHFHQVHKSLSCSHLRSHDYFLESIKSKCHFLGHKCHSWSDYEAGKCHGCSGGCPQMGLNAEKSHARGSFYLSTTQSAPFCGNEYFVEVDVPANIPDTYGKFYITITGQHGSTTETEFTRQNRFYTKSKRSEKHIIAVHGDVGNVTGVKLKFIKGDGLAGLGTPTEIKVQSITVNRLADSKMVKFCDNGATTFSTNQVHTVSHKC